MSYFNETDAYWMQQAYLQAEMARNAGEVPVGAVLVDAMGQPFYGHNAVITLSDPSAHAEVQAIRAATQYAKNYRLAKNATL